MEEKIGIAIGASSDPQPKPTAIEKARKFAERLSEYRDEVVLITGGDGGLMRIASEEFSKRGGVTVGVIPLEDESLSEGHPRYNPYNTIVIRSGATFQMRSIPIVRSCRSMVILGGGAGTMIEAFLAYIYGKPLIVLKGTGYPSDRLEDICVDGYLDHRRIVKLRFVEDPVAAADLAYELAKARS